METSLLTRRRIDGDTSTATDGARDAGADGSVNSRALERLDRWLESDSGASSSAQNHAAAAAPFVLASAADRMGKGALRMAAAATRKELEEAARETAGKIARTASGRVARFFAENGERRAFEVFSRVPRRTLANLAKDLPAKVEAHVLEHTRDVAGKAAHSQFAPGSSIETITSMAMAESEADAATDDAISRSRKANQSSWTEKALELLGPYGIFETSPIAIEPNFDAIRNRTGAAIDEARNCLGREPTADERRAIEKSVHDVWADAAGEANR